MSVTTTSSVRLLSEISSKPTVADPAPLGLGGFALTTFVLSAANVNLSLVGRGSLLSLRY